MKRDYKKLMQMALALCLAAVMVCSVVTEAQAAGFTKSFTQTATIKGGQQCMMTVELKKDAKVTVTVSSTSKNKNLNIQASFAGAYDGNPYFVNLTSKKKKASFTVNLEKGTTGLKQLYVSNYGSGKEKVKIKVSAKSAVLKYVKKEMITDVG